MSSELRVDKIIPTSGVPTGGGGGITRSDSSGVAINEGDEDFEESDN